LGVLFGADTLWHPFEIEEQACVIAALIDEVGERCAEAQNEQGCRVDADADGRASEFNPSVSNPVDTEALGHHVSSKAALDASYADIVTELPKRPTYWEREVGFMVLFHRKVYLNRYKRP
jgi:hypothetical protein